MLYHFSEEPGIELFKPLPSASYPNLRPAVWAIDHEHAVHYFLPRDCPRICFARAKNSTPEDIERFFGYSSAKRVIIVEHRWLKKIKATNLYRYSFAEDQFEVFDETAGYYISYQEAVPLKVEPLGELVEKIIETGTELRFTPNLFPIRDAVIQSSLDFSIIRFRNAKKG